ncbi:hypothetical protein [Curtobacterium sp. MCSS17_016]|uniref:hypothetical protein n=1 Tax=Curtobacterium sp. MCSS17_016 TaxID=2175644 RepID=UPI000DA7E570|nr:hypothetical protein [Curtobacterium sp. MCSS17_016]WIE81037.1 hypothetical protein DEJ19_021205 [Curtobacterium sp. MCSS17_016]
MPFTRTRTSPVGRTVWYAGTDAKPGSLLTGDLTIEQDQNENGWFGVRVTSNVLTPLRVEDMLPAVHDTFCTRKNLTPDVRLPCGCRTRAVTRHGLEPMSEEDRKILTVVIGTLPIPVSIAGRPDVHSGIRTIEDREELITRITDAGFRRTPFAGDHDPLERKALEVAIGYDATTVRVGDEFIRTFRTANDRNDTVHRILTAGYRLHPTVRAAHPALEGATA